MAQDASFWNPTLQEQKHPLSKENVFKLGHALTLHTNLQQWNRQVGVGKRYVYTTSSIMLLLGEYIIQSIACNIYISTKTWKTQEDGVNKLTYGIEINNLHLESPQTSSQGAKQHIELCSARVLHLPLKSKGIQVEVQLILLYQCLFGEIQSCARKHKSRNCSLKMIV